MTAGASSKRWSKAKSGKWCKQPRLLSIHEESLWSRSAAERWVIAEGYIPSKSHGPEPQMTSHETMCILNSSDQNATVQVTIFYADREPVGPYIIQVPARRTKHVRFNDLTDPAPIPLDTDYSSLIDSNVRIVVQHTRLDSRQAENALFSTMAFPV
ncbi:MAG: sensory rhodopsin transducer [Nitrospira sp.]